MTALLSEGIWPPLKKHAEKAERLIQTLTSDPTGSPPTSNGSPQDQQQKRALTVKRLIEDYDDRLAQAEIVREDAVKLIDAWHKRELGAN